MKTFKNLNNSLYKIMKKTKIIMSMHSIKINNSSKMTNLFNKNCKIKINKKILKMNNNKFKKMN